MIEYRRRGAITHVTEDDQYLGYIRRSEVLNSSPRGGAYRTIHQPVSAAGGERQLAICYSRAEAVAHLIETRSRNGSQSEADTTRDEPEGAAMSGPGGNMTENNTSTIDNIGKAISGNLYLLVLAANPTGEQLSERHPAITHELAARATTGLAVTDELVEIFREAWRQADADNQDGTRVRSGLEAVFAAIREGRA